MTSDLFPTVQLKMELNFKNGDILNNHFRIIEQTQGGNGMIYYCEDVYKHTPCLLKAHKIQFMEGKTAKDAEIFLKEAHALLKLPPHENVIRFMYMEVIQDIYFIVMEWCAYPLRKRMEIGDIFAPTAILRIAVAVCRGMQHCQKYLSEPGQPFVHGDLKPDNLYITSDGQVRISDFGGGYTTAYASPEQLYGRLVDERSDIYSLGIIILELLSQKLEGVSREMEKLPDIRRIAEKCSAEKPENRYQNFAELEEELGSVYQSITGFLPPAAQPVKTDPYNMELIRAYGYALTGENEKAYTMLTDLVNNPEVPDDVLVATYDDLGIFLYAQCRYEEALYCFRQVINLECGEQIRGFNGMAWVYCTLEDWDRAIECALEAIQIDGYNMEAIHYMVEALHKSGRTELFNQSVRILKEIHRKHPENRETLNCCGYVCYIQKKFEEAAAYYGEYFSLNNGDYESVFYYAMSLYMINDLTAAKKYFRKAIQMSKASGEVGTNRGKLLVLTYSSYYLTDYTASMEYVEQYENCGGNVEDISSIVYLWEYDMELLDMYHETQEALGEESASMVNVCIANPEGYFRNFVDRCTMLREKINTEAIEFSNYVKFVNLATYSYECTAWMLAGHYDEALKACECALEWDKSSPSNLFNKAEILFISKHYRNALKYYERALEYQDKIERIVDIKKRIEEVRRILQKEKTKKVHMSFFTFRDKYENLLKRLGISVERLSLEILQYEKIPLEGYIALEMIVRIENEVNNQYDYLEMAQSIPYAEAMYQIIDEAYLISKMCISVAGPDGFCPGICQFGEDY